MILGIVAGKAVTVEGVAFVAGTTATFIDTGTTIAQSAPPGVEDGDALFAVVFGRSALTPPLGWSLIESVDCASTAVAVQRTAVYRKDTVTSADASTSFSWDQVSSGRMGLSYAVTRSSSGAVAVAESAAAAINSTATVSITPPALAATELGELFLMCASTILGQATSSSADAPPGSTLWSGAAADMRIGAAWLSRNTGESNSGEFSFPLDGTENGLGAITIRLTAS